MSFKMSYAQVSSMTSMRFVWKSRYCVLTKIRIFFMILLFIAGRKTYNISHQCSSTMRCISGSTGFCDAVSFLSNSMMTSAAC